MHIDTRVIEDADFKSEFKFDLRFGISNLNYPGIDVNVASNSHCGLQTASEAASDLTIELSDLNNLC